MYYFITAFLVVFQTFNASLLLVEGLGKSELCLHMVQAFLVWPGFVFVWTSMSLLNHDCQPNCVMIFEGKRLTLRAVKVIRPCEEVPVHPYTLTYTLFPARLVLFLLFFFTLSHSHTPYFTLALSFSKWPGTFKCMGSRRKWNGWVSAVTGPKKTLPIFFWGKSFLFIYLF